MSLPRKVTVGVVGLIVVALVVAAGLSTFLVRRPLPEQAGTQTLRILGSRVEVVRDAHGVPQIYADSDADLMRAQGYVHAQDRFFEMDYRRHVTAGRLSELVGQERRGARRRRGGAHPRVAARGRAGVGAARPGHQGPLHRLRRRA